MNHKSRMRRWTTRPLRLFGALALISVSTLGAATVSYQATNLGGDLFRFDYFVAGIQFQQYQELDIRFDPALYTGLQNGSAGAGFDVLVLQPNNPPGAFGDYSAMALVNNPSLSTPFRVEAHFLGLGSPAPQPYVLHQLDANGNVVSTIGSGETVAVNAVPEPAAIVSGGAGLLLYGVIAVWRRRINEG